MEIPDQIAETERLSREVTDVRNLLGVDELAHVGAVKARIEDLLTTELQAKEARRRIRGQATAEKRAALLENEPWLRTGISTEESFRDQLGRLLRALGCDTTREALDVLGREYTEDETAEAWDATRASMGENRLWAKLAPFDTSFFTAFANALPPRIRPGSDAAEELERLRAEHAELNDENDALSDERDTLRDENAALRHDLKQLNISLRAPLTESDAKAWLAENWDKFAVKHGWPQLSDYIADGADLPGPAFKTHNAPGIVLRFLLDFANRRHAPSTDWNAIQAAVASEDLEALRELVGGES